MSYEEIVHVTRKKRLPRIRRVWGAQTGRFYWAVNEVPQKAWGMGVDPDDRKLWNEAHRFAFQLNQKEKDVQDRQ